MPKIFLLVFTFISAQIFAQSSKPNILVIFSDDHTQQTISIYGGKVMVTPNIDRIAKEGAILKKTFVTLAGRLVFLASKLVQMRAVVVVHVSR